MTIVPRVSERDISIVCTGDITVLDEGQPFDAFYQWNTGSQMPSIEISSPGLYSVNVSTPCFDIHDEVAILRADQCGNGIYVPNVFSPNNDGVNDTWIVGFEAGLQLLQMQCNIYDRWGNMIYQSTDLLLMWNGKVQDEDLNPGVYVYTLTMTYLRGSEEVNANFKGDITLVR